MKSLESMLDAVGGRGGVANVEEYRCMKRGGFGKDVSLPERKKGEGGAKIFSTGMLCDEVRDRDERPQAY